jgi:pyruvate,water dikinase
VYLRHKSQIPAAPRRHPGGTLDRDPAFHGRAALMPRTACDRRLTGSLPPIVHPSTTHREHFVEDRWITDWTPSERWPHYTRANAGEVLPTPVSPLGQTFTWDKGICLGWRDGYVRQGVIAPGEMADERPEACGFFGGYFYINLANVRMQGVRSPAVTVEQLDMAFFGDHPDVPPYVEHPDDVKPELTDAIVAHLGWVLSTSKWQEFDDSKAETIAMRANRPDLSAMSPAELVDYARATQPLLVRLFEEHTVTSSSSGIAPGILFAIGQAIGDPSVPMRLIAGIGEVDSAEPSYALWDMSRAVARSEELTAAFDAGIAGLLDRLRASGSADAQAFLDSWDDFSLRFGSRGPNEWEIIADTWETRPEIALALIDRIRFQSDDESPTKRNANKAAEREAITAEVRAKVAELGDEELMGQFEGAMIASNQMSFRERTKTNIIRVVHEGRMAFRELGRQMHAAGHVNDPLDVFMLTDDELDAFVADPASFTETLTQRRADYVELGTLQPPFFIKDGVVPPIGSWPKKGAEAVEVATPGTVLQGVPGCAGIVRGTARVVLDPTDPMALEPGDILVAPLTDPAWTPLFMAAGGVVVDVGGQISHSIIVSRELGLPCVVSVTNGTRLIPDGAQIEVNGDTGQITIL